MAVVLLVGVILLFVFSYVVIDRDFLSPINLYLLFSILAISAMFLCYTEWKLNEYGALATIVYLTGSIAYMLGCQIAKSLSMRSINKRIAYEFNEIKSERIELGYFKVAIMIITGILALYGTYSYIRRLGNFSIVSIMGLGQVIQGARRMKVDGILFGENKKTFIWSVFSVLSVAFAHFSSFVLVKNIVNKCFKKRDLFLIIPLLLYILESLLNSSRGYIIQIFFAIIISWFISAKYNIGWRKRINIKAIKFTICIVLIVAPIFFGSLVFLGRFSTYEGFDFKQYALKYMSGGVRNLDLYLKEPTETNLFGEETFINIHRSRYIKKGIGDNITIYHEFRKIDGINMGNIYTSYRRFYHDFGFAGCLILPLVQGLILSSLYYNINRNPSKSKLSFIEIMYCWLSYATIYIVLEDLFFTQWFYLWGLKKLLAIFVAYLFIFNTSMRNGVIKIDFGRLKINRR